MNYDDKQKCKRDNFWNNDPKNYANNITSDLDDDKKNIFYPIAYVFRLLFTKKLWLFALPSVIIVIMFTDIFTNNLTNNK